MLFCSYRYPLCFLWNITVFIIRKEKLFRNNFVFSKGHDILDAMKKVMKLLNEKQNPLMKNGTGIVMSVLAFLVFLLCVSKGLGEDIWFDEVFSVNFIRHGYGEIASLTAQDVHPPFYYWYLKLFHDAGKMLFPAAGDVMLCKMASLLPFVGIFVYAFTLVRKNFGIQVAGLFLFLIAAMPQISNYYVEIRMYSPALFLITAVFLHGYELVKAAQKEMSADGRMEACGCVETDAATKVWKKKQNVHLAAFWLYGMLTAYTQYYACVAVVAVYLALFTYFLLRKQKRYAVKIAVCAGVSVLGYLPWLPSFFKQVTAVSSSYWIQPLTWRSVFGCMKFVFLPGGYGGIRNYTLAVLMIGIFGLSFLYCFFQKKEAEYRYLLLCGSWIPVFTALTGFVCSALDRPIFVYRYLIPCLGAMWLVAAKVLADTFSKNWGILILVPFLMAGYSNMQGFYAEEQKKLTEMESTQEFLETFPEDVVVICNFNHVQAVTSCYLGDGNLIYLYGGEPEALIAELLPNCKGLPDTEDLKKLVNRQDVYFFGSFNSREDLLAEWEQDGIMHTEEGTYLLERYYFNVYHLITIQSHADL